MKPTPTQLERALAVAYALKDSAAHPSFNADPCLYVERIARAVLEDVPEPETATRD